MIRTLEIAAIISLATMLTSSLTAHAQSTFATAQLDRPSGIFDGAINETLVNPGGPIEHRIADSWGSASTFALADYGILKASATASATAEPYGRFSARSGVGFNDQLTFTSAGFDGQAGTLNATILFDRALSVQGNAVDSYAAATLNVGTSFDTLSYQELLSLQPSGCNPVGSSECDLQLTTTSGGTGTIQFTWRTPTMLSLAIPITFGQNTSFFLSLDMTTLATYYEGPSTWQADASRSLYWGGINAVLAASGQPVSFAVTSASGTDYLQSFAPVPEPTTFSMLIVGLLGLLASRHRFKR